MAEEKTAMEWYALYEKWVYTQTQLTPLTRHTYTTHAKRMAKWIEDNGGTITTTKEAV